MSLGHFVFRKDSVFHWEIAASADAKTWKCTASFCFWGSNGEVSTHVLLKGHSNKEVPT